MGFTNVNKVELKDSTDIVSALSNTMLMAASMVYDEIEAKNYNQALQFMEMLDCSVKQLACVLLEKATDENKSN